jgi:phosphatidylglycerophosphatase A
MGRLAKFIATSGGLGFAPIAPGTAGSLAGVVLGLLWTPEIGGWLPLAAVAVLFVIGVAVSTRVERDLQALDPSCIVIDETVAMWLILLAVPAASWQQAIIPFLVFRLFDIVKPPPLKWMAKAPGGWGVMLDDIGAAVYTILVLLLIAFAAASLLSSIPPSE